MTKHTLKALQAAFKGRECSGNPGCFVVWDDKANEELSREFGLFTDETPTYNINNAFKVRFTWSIQRWLVSA